MNTATQASQLGAPGAVNRVLSGGRVWIIQSVGTLLCLLLASACSWIGTDSWWRLDACGLLAIPLAYVAAFIQRTALRVYRRARLESAMPVKPARKVRRRKLSDRFTDAAIVFVLFFGLVGCDAVILQVLPPGLEGAERMQCLIVWLLFIVFWLPLAAAALLGEPRMWGSALSAWRRSNYWLKTLICVVVSAVFWERVNSLISLTGFVISLGAALALLALACIVALGAWLMILALAEEAIASAEPRSVDDTWD